MFYGAAGKFWAPAAGPVGLEPNEVQIWQLSGSEWSTGEQALRTHLPRLEQARADRVRPGRPRTEFIAARAALRMLLSEWIGGDPATFELKLGEFGKPTCEGIEFNLSHSDGRVLIAASRSIPLGIDVERPGPATELIEISKETFTARERATLLAAQDDAARARIFGQTWSRKEAVVKAHGKGLTLPLTEIEVLSRGTEAARTIVAADERSGRPEDVYTAWDLAVDGGFFAAIAVRGDMPNVRQFEWKHAA